MSQPTRNDVRAVDPVLTNMLVAYMNGDERYVSGVCPGVEVQSSEGTYFTFDKGYWFEDGAKLRAWGGDYQEGGFNVSTDTYKTEQYARKYPIPDEVRADSQVPLDLEDVGIKWLSNQLLIRHEREFGSTFMATSVWDTDKSVSVKWDDTGSDPVGDVRTGKRTISQATAQIPNLMILGEIVEDRLLNHPDLIDRIKHTQMATVQTIRQALAAVLGVDRIAMGNALYNTVNVAQTASLSPIIDDDALLVYNNPSPTPAKFQPSAMYRFFWTPGGGVGGVREPFYDNDKDSDVLKAKMQIDYKVVATDCGYFFSDVCD